MATSEYKTCLVIFHYFNQDEDSSEEYFPHIIPGISVLYFGWIFYYSFGDVSFVFRPIYQNSDFIYLFIGIDVVII